MYNPAPSAYQLRSVPDTWYAHLQLCFAINSGTLRPVQIMHSWNLRTTLTDFCKVLHTAALSGMFVDRMSEGGELTTPADSHLRNIYRWMITPSQSHAPFFLRPVLLFWKSGTSGHEGISCMDLLPWGALAGNFDHHRHSKGEGRSGAPVFCKEACSVDALGSQHGHLLLKIVFQILLQNAYE